MFVSFIPFFTILLPLKVEAVAGGESIAVLGWLTLLGAIAASIANIGFGALSDRTFASRGTRRPWVAAGLAATIIAYGTVHLATGVPSLTGAIILFQLGLNMMFAPMAAVLADEIPDGAKGMAAALLSCAQPLASVAGVLIVTPALDTEAVRYAAICLLALAMMAPFLLLGGEDGGGSPAGQGATERAQVPVLDLVLAWTARFSVQIAGTALVTYLFFYFQNVLRSQNGGSLGAGSSQQIASAMAIATIVAVALALLAGRLSDRMGRRKPLLAVAAIAMAVGLCIMALATSWTAAALGYAVFASAYTIFVAIHSALAMQLLPSPQHRGRDLGILNLTNTIPSVIGPLIALFLLSEAGGYRSFLLVIALLAGLGAASALFVRSER